MTEEQIKQNARVYANKEYMLCTSGEKEAAIKDFIAGAHSRDEEIYDLKRDIEDLQKMVKMRSDAFECARKEIERLSNPWISVKEKRPPIKTRVLFLDYNGKAWFGKNTISDYAELESDKQEILPPPTVPACKPIITHWMPIPEIPTKQ